MKPWTLQRIRQAKGRQKLACLTAFDAMTARRLDEAGLPLILVGDSLGMTALGYATTLPVTLEEMLHHTAAVVRGVRQALVVADMPFLTYQVSIEQAIRNAGRFLKEAGAHAVKIEGGALRAELVRRLTENGIPVMGHIGMLPQSVQATGGYHVQARTPDEARTLLEDAAALEQAGAFALVLECIPPEPARMVTETIGIPTIGIGAGPHCDGQILVTSDMLGFGAETAPRFVKRYAALNETLAGAFAAYRQEVESGEFPAARHTYTAVCE